MSSSDPAAERTWRSADVGVLLLRLAFGLSVCVLFGFPKIAAAVSYLRTGHWSFVDFNCRVGLPFPVAAAFLQTLNEAGATLLVAAGLFTRVAATSLFVGFAVAAASSRIAHEDIWLLAAAYAVTFGAIALIGPGSFALDSRRRWLATGADAH